MTPDQARAAVYDEFLTQWADETPVILEGQAGPQAAEPEPGVKWVRVAFRNLGGGQLTLGASGGRKYRRDAAALVQVFVPSVAGTGPGATLAHAARAIFEGKAITVGSERVEFNDGRITEVPLSGGERSLQTNVEVRCTYDETK